MFRMQVKSRGMWASVGPSGGKPYEHATAEDAAKAIRMCYPDQLREDRLSGAADRVTLPRDAEFMSRIRWAGDEAWYESTDGRTPFVSSEAYSLLLKTMSEVYDLTPLAKWWAMWEKRS